MSGLPVTGRIRWLEWLPLGLFLGVAAWFLVAALPGGGSGAAPDQAAVYAEAPVPAVLLPETAPEAPAGSPADTQDSAPAGIGPDTAVVSADWARAASGATGIPQRALLGYAGAALRVAGEQPGCGLGWTTLAALGAIESDHGRHGASAIGADGQTAPGILGPLLDGTVYDAFPDTDAGLWDGDAQWDRAVGPLQFIPATWSDWGADGNGDGVADPQQIDDAALTTARYLCDTGDLTTPAAWRAAVYSYNHVDSYVDLVAATANGYAARMP
ncbi:lytic murein transglycosylase [Cryobacterium arcticum]|uniref:lytic murein transglycosylase n=1 Tax=Cryobacterium arcticum TaxID=670052 RepID=UPI00082C2F3E|nr:lytic murein transglycosylase [Cryobacterium arcticum]